jgi:DNA repair exonuclease SbcCD ATPase subunit
MHLKHLSISGFRGIGLHLDLPLDHRTILYGPNGSGKSNILQAIAWTIYGKLPLLTGGVFIREDALVNDFLDEAMAAVTLTLSDNVTITRTRNKQSSTTRGTNPLVTSFEADDPQVAVEQLIGLTLEEFLAAVFLHQETIRDFITTTPESRSATIDRMLGTYLLRTLVKVVDPKVPAKAIEEAEETIKRLDRQLSQASVISREVIQERRKEHGDPAELPQLLEDICQLLVPITGDLELSAPEATIVGLESSLAAAHQGQLNTVSALENRAGQLGTLKERYEQASVTSWQVIQERKDKYGDPSDLPKLLEEIQRNLTPVVKTLDLPVPEATINSLESSLAATRRAQLTTSGGLEKKAGQLGTLKERYEQISKEVIEDISVPTELEGRRNELQARSNVLNQAISVLTRQLDQCQATEQDLAELRREVQALPGLCNDIGEMERKLETLEAASKQGTLYNQILTVGQEYLEQAQPEHCPLCKQKIESLQALLKILHQETPADVEKVRQEHQTVRATLVQKQDAAARLEQKQQRIERLEIALTEFPKDLESQIEEKQKESEDLTNELTTVQAEITQIEGRIKLVADHRRRLGDALREIEMALGRSPGEDVAGALEQEIKTVHTQATDVQALDIQPIADKLDRAKQLSQIQKDEAHLRQRLDAVLEEVRQALGRSPGEDVAGALEQETQTVRKRATEIQALNFQPIVADLNRAKQLDEIQKDESRLRQFESSYQTASQEKARLNYRIQRLTELRNALQDIAETTKHHQQTIVTSVLNALDIHRYYQQLDPHPAYRQLQIEPELTKKGTYDYWIKALTDDRSHGTYVQTRFSTAQANCAAIAIFLAVNQHLSKKLETIILDDPSQSMDPDHKMRLAQTLATIPHQVIVATEDPQTFEFLKDVFETPTIYQLGSWTVDGASLVG